uniref:TLC domain-containing protein n=1 Tax=Pyxicephalus adspersus TaxID=30357 RepID=A0AAV3ASF5_PYXAD|nr:TPA: hypothetical protein GDO54_008693 [Pyxicephalus adspersus]
MEQEHKIQSIQIPSSLGYVDLLIKSGECFFGALKECKDCGLTSSWKTLQAHAKFTWIEMLCVIVCALAWTGLRIATTKWIFQPFSKWCRLRPKEAEKVPESAWKFLFYCASWSYCSYLLFFTKHNFFHDPPSAFRGWTSEADVPTEIALLYLVQGSFYAHSVYATLYMDAWRKDSVVMILHHLVTFTLIVFSYAFRFWFRLYWFPMKVLYVTCCSSLESNPDIPFYFFFNVLLFALTLMNIYWFMYIVMFVVKVLTGQVKEVNDVRDYDVSENQKVSNDSKTVLQNNSSDNKQPMANGFVKKKRV